VDRGSSPKELKSTEVRTNSLLVSPKSERPRERLIEKGAQALSLTELIAILLGTGTKGIHSLDLARKLLSKDSNLKKLTFHELKSEKGVGETKAARLIAALELGKRAYIGSKVLTPSIQTSLDAYQYLKPKLSCRSNEVFAVVTLDIKSRPLAYREIAQGSPETVSFLPRDLFSDAIRLNASAVLCAHNHPSGDPTPSHEDRGLTGRLIEVSRALGIRFLDHLIVAEEMYYSFSDSTLKRV